MVCKCQSGRRDFIVVVPNSDDHSWPDARQIAKEFDWSVDASVRAVRIPLGGSEDYDDPGEVVSFFRTEFGDEVDHFRGMTLDPDEPLDEHYDDLVCASSLKSAFDSDRTRLLNLLQDRRIETRYQPIFAGDELELYGVECLMRGLDRHGEPVYPNTLLTEAHDQNLQFMLDRICREVHIRNAEAMVPDRARIFVNFLPSAIYRPEFCLRTTIEIVDELDIDHDRIVFEIVETEEVDDREHLVDLLEFYREAGFGVALDDVGAGYSGLTMLAELGPDIIKIDKEIIWRVAESDEHRAICKSLRRMASSDDQLLLAEGVETPEQFEFLDSLGTDLYQGYLFREPNTDPELTPEWTPS